MAAIVGLILFVIAGIFELVNKHLNYVIWLIIIGAALVAIDVIWGRPWVNYRRGAGAP